MKQLIAHGEKVDTAYFLAEGDLYSKIGHGSPEIVPGEKFLFGTLEFFLKENEQNLGHRILDFYTSDSAITKKIPLETVSQMMQEYRFGFSSNIFLARLLDLTNKYFVIRSSEIPKELWIYKLRAQHYSKLINAIENLGKRCDIPGLNELAIQKKELEFYQDGVMLHRDMVLRSISNASQAMTKFIKRFPKNSTLCREGAIADSMYILLRGKIAVAKGGRRCAMITQKGECFGEMGLFLDGKRTATLLAEENSDVYIVKRDDLGQFFAGHKNLFSSIATTLARRICDNVNSINRFEVKISQLLEEESRTRGLYNSLEEVSKLELNALLQELTVIQFRFRHPELEQLLALQKTKDSDLLTDDFTD